MPIFVYIAIGFAAAGYYQAKKAQKAAKKAAEDMAGILYTKESTIESVPVIYGERRTGGTRVFIETKPYFSGDKHNKELYMAIVLSEGEVESINDIWIDDKPLSKYSQYFNSTVVSLGNVTYVGQNQEIYIEKFLGSDNQAASTVLQEAPSWGTNHKLSGFAYLAVRIRWNDEAFQGIPDISALVKGRKVFDPRTSTTAYSTNAALCLRDYLLNDRFGKALPADSIDEAAFIQAANDIDSFTVTPYAGGPAGTKLFELNAAIKTDEELFQNVEKILMSCRGFLPYRDGKYGLTIDQASSPIMTIDSDIIIGGINIDGGKKDDRFNIVEVKFPNKKLDYNVDTAFWPDPSSSNPTSFSDGQGGFLTEAELHAQFVAEDLGHVLKDDIDLDHVTNYYAARDLARIFCLRSRNNLGVKIKCTSEAADLVVGDVVGITHPTPAWTNKPFQVESVTLENDGTVSLQLLEYVSNIYAYDPANVERDYPDTELPDPFVVLAPSDPEATNVSALLEDGTLLPRMKVTWTAADDSFVEEYEIRYRLGGTTKYEYVRSREAERIIEGIRTGTYDVGVRSINSMNVKSAWVDVPYANRPVLTKDTTEPSDITSFTATAGPRQVTLSWTNPADVDYKQTLIYRATTDSAPADPVYIVTGDTFVATDLTPDQDYYFWVQNEDFAGNKATTKTASGAVTPFKIDLAGENNSSGWVDATGAANAAPVQSVDGSTGTVTVRKSGIFGPLTTDDNAAPSNTEFNTIAGRNPVEGDFLTTVDTTTDPDTYYGWRYTGTAWAAASSFLHGDLLVSGTIAADKLVANSIDTTKLTVGVTTSLGLADSAIQANDNISLLNNDSGYTTFDANDVENAIANNVTTIDGAKITTGTISANKIELSPAGMALNDDPYLLDTSTWEKHSELTYTDSATAVGADGARMVYSADASVLDRKVWTSRKYPISPNKTYRLTANLWTNPSNNRNMYIFVRFYDHANNYIGSDVTGWGGTESGYTYGGQPPKDNQWHVLGGTFGAANVNRPIPSNVRYAVVGVWFQYGSGSGSVAQGAQNIRLEEIISADLIVDGTIAATKFTTAVNSSLGLADSSLQDNDTGVNLGLTGGSVGGITITSTELYAGAGNWANADTGFYLDNTGKFSLDNKLSFDPSTDTLRVAGLIEAVNLTVTGEAKFANVIADEVKVGSITYDMLSGDVKNAFQADIAISTGGTAGDYQTNTATIPTTIALPIFAHGQKPVELTITASKTGYHYTSYTTAQRTATYQIQRSTDNVNWTNVTGGSGSIVISQYDISNYYGGGSTAYYHAVNFSAIVTEDPAIANYYYRVTFSAGSAFSDSNITVSSVLTANEAASGVTSSGGNADTLDNLDSTKFMRTDENTGTTGNLQVGGNLDVTGDLNITGNINSYNVTDLDVSDTSITLNAGGAALTADGAGLYIEKAVDASTDASITWDATNDQWEASHTLTSFNGFSSDNQAKSYTWRAVANTGNTGVEYIKICRITGVHSTRFMITLSGRSTSYGDGSFSSKVEIYGQLNNDSNYDISAVYYNFSGAPVAVDEIGQVDIDAGSTDLYVKMNSYSEVVAHGIISLGTITVVSGTHTQGTDTAPAGYTVLNGRNIYTDADFSATDITNWNSAYSWGNHAGLYLLAAGKAADSEKIDGYDSSQIVLGDYASGMRTAPATQDMSSKSMWGSGFWETYNSDWAPSNGWWWGLTAGHSSNSPTYNYSLQIAASNGTNSNLQFRTISNGANNGWSKIYNDNYHPNADNATNAVTAEKVSNTGTDAIITASNAGEVLLANHTSDSTPVPFDIRKSGSANTNSKEYGVIHVSRTNHVNTDVAGANIHFRLKNDAGTLTEYGGIGAYKTGNTTGELNFYTSVRVNDATLQSDGDFNLHRGGYLINDTRVISAARDVINVNTLGVGTASPANTVHVNGATSSLRVGPYYTTGGDRDAIVLQAGGVLTSITSNNEDFTIQNSNGNINIAPSNKLNLQGRIFETEVIKGNHKSWSSLTGTSGQWYKIAQVSDNHSNAAMFMLKTYAHGGVVFTVARGYGPSNTMSINVLNYDLNWNGGYAVVTALQVDTSGWIYAKLEWSSGPLVYISLTGISSAITPMTVAADLTGITTPTSITDTVNLQRGLMRGYALDARTQIMLNGTRHIDSTGVYSFNKLYLKTDSITSSDTASGLQIDGNYTDGRYRTRFRKQDNGGGIPLYIDRSMATSNSYTPIVRIGEFTNNPEYLEVYGRIKHQGVTLTDGYNVDQIKTYSVVIQASTTWQDTGINGAELAQGMYAVMLHSSNYTVGGGNYDERYCGVLAWYSGNPNNPESDEIPLHQAGHASNNGHLFLRTIRTYSADANDLKLQIACTGDTSGTSTYTFTFRRLI